MCVSVSGGWSINAFETFSGCSSQMNHKLFSLHCNSFIHCHIHTRTHNQSTCTAFDFCGSSPFFSLSLFFFFSVLFHSFIYSCFSGSCGLCPCMPIFPVLILFLVNCVFCFHCFIKCCFEFSNRSKWCMIVCWLLLLLILLIVGRHMCLYLYVLLVFCCY